MPRPRMGATGKEEEKNLWWLETHSQHRETDQEEEQMRWRFKTHSQHRETDQEEEQMRWSLETCSQNWQKISSVYPHSSTALRTDEGNHNLYEQVIFIQTKFERTFLNSPWKNTLFASQSPELFNLSPLNT